MKRVQNILTTLIVLQVAVVLLLGVMTIFSYQNREELNQLRQQWTAQAESEPEAAPADAELERRLAVIESRLGLRDPEADALKQALATEKATAATLEERLIAVRETANAANLKGSLPPADSEEAPANLTMRPLANPNPILDQPEPEEGSIGDLQPVATLTSYNTEWQFWKANVGRFDRIRKDQEFAVRKKGTDQLLARVKVASVKESECVVDLVPGTLTDPEVLPAAGDELVDTRRLQ